MNNEDDPFVRKRRSKKPTKRRRRPERVASIDDSDAADTYFPKKSSMTENIQSTVAKCRPSSPTARRPRVFGMPTDLHGAHASDKVEVDKDDAKPDYSEAGLRRLRELTFNKPPAPPPPPPDEPKPFDEVLENAEISMQPPPSPPRAEAPELTSAKFVRSSTTLPNIRQKKKIEIIDVDDPAAGFVSRERERTELKLGVMNGDDIEAMELERAEGEESGADDWEREQLRRVGIAVAGDGVDGKVDARAIIEEEDLSLANVAKGEVGLSHLDTFLEAVDEAVSTSAAEIKLCGNKRDELLATRREHADAETKLDEKVATAVNRRTFYKELHQFAEEMADALADVHERITKRHKARVTRLEATVKNEIAKIQERTDEFGRTVNPTDIVRRRLDDWEAEDDVPDDEGRGVYYDDVLSDVPREYATVARVAARFKDWSRRFPNEYANAHGDRLVGNAVGWVVKGTAPPVTELQWLRDVPKGAHSHALVEAGIPELSALVLRTKWNVYTSKSTRKYAEMVCATLHCLSEGTALKLLDAISHRVRDEDGVLAQCDASLAMQARERVYANITWMLDMCVTEDSRASTLSAVANIRAIIS